jgi:hypothetical protein
LNTSWLREAVVGVTLAVVEVGAAVCVLILVFLLPLEQPTQLRLALVELVLILIQ